MKLYKNKNFQVVLELNIVFEVLLELKKVPEVSLEKKYPRSYFRLKFFIWFILEKKSFLGIINIIISSHI